MQAEVGGTDWKVGVDIGGTFIDFCALETGSGRLVSLKVLTTPEDPGAELISGLDILAAKERLDAASISRFVHGTTVGINTAASAARRASMPGSSSRR